MNNPRDMIRNLSRAKLISIEVDYDRRYEVQTEDRKKVYQFNTEGMVTVQSLLTKLINFDMRS